MNPLSRIDVAAALRALAPSLRAEWCSAGWGMRTTGGAVVDYGGSCWFLAGADPRDIDLFQTYARYLEKRCGHSGLVDDFLDALRHDRVAFRETGVGDSYVDEDCVLRSRMFGTIEHVPEAAARYWLKRAVDAPSSAPWRASTHGPDFPTAAAPLVDTSTPTRPAGRDRVPLTIKDCAERLGVSDDQVARLIKAGKLPAFKVGTRRWRINQDDLDRLRDAAPDKYPGRKR
jgi:excisionase family DNA binding protein